MGYCKKREEKAGGEKGGFQRYIKTNYVHFPSVPREWTERGVKAIVLGKNGKDNFFEDIYKKSEFRDLLEML
jgi:hypothetical protein